MDVSSMNKSDCFILDGGKNHSILVYMPAGARKMEQFRAIQVANEIRDEDHAGHAEVEVIGKTDVKIDFRTSCNRSIHRKLQEVF